MVEEKTYTEKQMLEIVDEVRIQERFIANEIMGNLGIPADRRIGPGGKSIYIDAARIVTARLLTPKREQDMQPLQPSQES